MNRKVDSQALKLLIEESGLVFRQNKRSYVFTCPRCDKKDKLMMFKDDGKFVCWVCAETSGYKGRPEYALVDLLGMPMRAICERIYGDQFEKLPVNYLDIKLIDFFGDEEVPSDFKPPKVIQFPFDFYPIEHPHAAKGRAYLEGRGIGLDLAKAYRLRYHPVQRRVIFPVYGSDGLIGWQARAIFQTEWEDPETGQSKKCPKILTTGFESNRDNVLMFQERLGLSDHAVLCEGPVDAIKAHLCGSNVATMGKVVGEGQIALLRNAGIKRIYLALDPDAAQELSRICFKFGDLEIRHLTPAPGFEDLGEMSPEMVLNQMRSAPRIFPGQVFVHLRPAFRAPFSV